MSKNPTPEQALAINTIKSNVSLLAGAGSGKTYVLMKRFVQILRSDLSVNPTNIVAITFTRKAADEIKGRVRQAVSECVEQAQTDLERLRWQEHLLEGQLRILKVSVVRLERDLLFSGILRVEEFARLVVVYFHSDVVGALRVVLARGHFVIELRVHLRFRRALRYQLGRFRLVPGARFPQHGWSLSSGRGSALRSSKNTRPALG